MIADLKIIEFKIGEQVKLEDGSTGTITGLFTPWGDMVIRHKFWKSSRNKVTEYIALPPKFFYEQKA